MRNLALAAAVLSLSAPALAGAIPDYIGFTGSYAQNFDTLPRVDPSGSVGTAQVGFGPHLLNTGFGIGSLQGWFGANSGGTASNTEFKAHNGSRFGSDGRGVISYGLNDSTDRSLGALATSNQVNTFGAVLRNETNSAVEALELSFSGQQWRRGDRLDTNPFVSRLRFSFSVFTSNPSLIVVDDLLAANASVPTPPPNPPSFTNIDALSFTSPNRALPINVGIDGNDAANQVALAAQISSLNWAPGSYLAVRWTINESTGQDDGLGIDDLFISLPSITPTFVKGDFGGNESSDGSFNSPDGSFNELDVEGFLLALNNQAAYLALNPTIANTLVGRGDFGGNESLNGSFNTPDGSFNELDVEGFLLALNDPAGYAAIQPPGLGGVSAIPEPAALSLLAPLGLLLARRRR